MKKQRLYMISLDAFGTRDLEYARTLPTFNYLLNRSALVEKVETVYPSLTYMAHTSIVTGVYPNKHGITNNTYTQPKRQSPDWHWYAKDIKVPSQCMSHRQVRTGEILPCIDVFIPCAALGEWV